MPLDKIATASNGSAGVVALASMEEEIEPKHGKPQQWRRVTANQTPVDGLAWAVWGGGKARSSGEAG